jgi:hypothetical protein
LGVRYRVVQYIEQRRVWSHQKIYKMNVGSVSPTIAFLRPVPLIAKALQGSTEQHRQRYFDHAQLSGRDRGAPKRDSRADKETLNRKMTWLAAITGSNPRIYSWVYFRSRVWLLPRGCCVIGLAVPERDANKEALRQVEKATGSDPVDGKDLLESDALRRQLDEAKQSLDAPPKPSGKKPG